MQTDIERRFLAECVEFRASADGPGTLYGYAAKFDRLSQNLGGFVEKIDGRAFNKSLGDKLDVMARYNHDNDFLLGRTASGTVRLKTDSIGLMYEVDLPDTSVGRDIAVLARRGDVYQSSFAFRTVEDSWDYTDSEMAVRTLLGVQLVDVAPVNSPAYLDTSAGMRSLAAHANVGYEEVRSAAEAGENLARFLVPVETEQSVSSEVEDGQRATHPTPSVMSLLMELNTRKF